MTAIMKGSNSNRLLFLLLCASIVCKCLGQSNPQATDPQATNLSAINLPETYPQAPDLPAANPPAANPPAKEKPKEKPPLSFCSKSEDHKYCKAPTFTPKNPSMPQQVHLALTGQPGEMNITWITFHDDKYLENVSTFVQYWKVNNANAKTTLKADRKRHAYTDKFNLECTKEDKPENWNEIKDNARFIHTITLKDLVDNQRYEYEVFYCVPRKLANGRDCICAAEIGDGRACELRRRETTFNFTMFPWSRNGADADPFTIVVFGDLGLKKKMSKAKDKLRSTEKSDYFDSMAPQSMQALVELIHRPHNNLKHPMLKDKPREHPIRRSHLNANSSGLDMNNVQLILHIGDIAYDLHEWRTRREWGENGKTKNVLYNVGDRFMNVVEDVAAYVPYMVIAGNHENEEADTWDLEHKLTRRYEHYETRYNMPRNFYGHSTNQFYQFVYGPIWFIAISTEFYYSWKTKKPFKYYPDYKMVQQQYDFIEYSLIKANRQRDKYPWVVVIQHRPFHCTSRQPFTCRGNKNHKAGVPDPSDPKKLVYGLEALYNKYNVDLVITGHEHTYEMFPPIQLHKKKNRVIPHKYWWHAKRRTVIQEPKKGEIENGISAETKSSETKSTETNPTETKPEVKKFREHQFMAYTDPIAPTYVIVGRPGNAEEMEKLHSIAQLQRVKQYNPFSITLLHYPGKDAKNALISVRQVDIQNGYVPLEFALEKTFALYDKQLICQAMDREELGLHHREENRSKYWLERTKIIEHRKAFTVDEKFLKKALENPEEFSMFYLEEQAEMVSVTDNKKAVKKKMVMTQKWPKKWNDRVKKIEAKYARQKEEYKKNKQEDLTNQRSVLDDPDWFTPEELAEINREMNEATETAVPQPILRRSKSEPKLENESIDEVWQKVQQQFMMRDPEKYKEQKEMEQQLLLQETAEEASVNSKIRALLHAFHMNRADPENSHLSSIYQMAKLRVCQNYDSLVAYLDEQNLVQMKFVDNRYKQLEEKFSIINPGKNNRDNYVPHRNIALLKNDVRVGVQKPTNTPSTPYAYSERQEMRKIANILAFYYLAAFFEVGIGKCDKLPLFHVSNIDDFYNKGQKKIWLDHGAVQKILKASTVKNGTTKENHPNAQCFSIDYMNEYDKKYFKIPKASGNDDDDSSKLEMQQELVKKRHEYGPMLKQLFTDRRISLNNEELITLAIPAHGTTHLERFVSPKVVLRKIQENSLDKANFFTKQKVQWMVVDDPVLVPIIMRYFGQN